MILNGVQTQLPTWHIFWQLRTDCILNGPAVGSGALLEPLNAGANLVRCSFGMNGVLLRCGYLGAIRR